VTGAMTCILSVMGSCPDGKKSFDKFRFRIVDDACCLVWDDSDAKTQSASVLIEPEPRMDYTLHLISMDGERSWRMVQSKAS